MFAYVVFAFSTPSFFSITDAARQEQLFQAWNLAKAETRSLVVMCLR